MKDFCTECGTRLDPGSQHCKSCGEPVEKQQRSKPVTPKKPRSKKQQIIQRSLIGVAILIVGFGIWASNYHSAQNVEKRYEAAIAKQDSKKVRKLVIHDDGGKITLSEAKALLTLAKQEGDNTVQKLSEVIQHGRFLGLFPNHKIELTKQYIYYNELAEGLSFELDGQQAPEFERTDETITFGPITPGVYKVQAKFDGAYASASNSITMTLADKDLNDQWIDIDLSISKVFFEISPFDPDIMTDAFISFGEEKFYMDENGEVGDIGPFLIDGSQAVTATVTMPWGEIISAEAPIDSSYVTITPTFISNKQYTEITDLIVNYGEQYTEAFAMRDATPFASILATTGGIIEQKLSWLLSSDNFQSSKFNLAKINKDSLVPVNKDDSSGIRIYAQLYFDTAIHELTDKPEFGKEINDMEFTFLYNQKKKEWLLDNARFTNFWEFEATDEHPGSGKLQKPSDELIAKQKNSDRDKQIEQFMIDFHELSVTAINYGDFGYVENYHTANGPSGKEAKDYLGYLVDKGITEDHIQTVVEKIEQVDETTWKVTSIDEYIIRKDGNSTEKKFRSVTIIKQVDDYFGMHELISTDEIK